MGNIGDTMNKSIVPSSPSCFDLSGQIEMLLAGIRECNDPQIIEDFYRKVRATREYNRIYGDIQKQRIELLRVEITCIVRAGKLGQKIKGVNISMQEYFVKHGEDISVYLSKFPEEISASQIYRAYLRREGLLGIKTNGARFAAGTDKASIYDMPREEVEKVAIVKYYDTESAMKTIVDDLAGRGQHFTIEEMADKYLEATTQEPDTVPDAFKAGIREVCRASLMKSKIDTIGEKKAPRFVTCTARLGEDENANRWARIPFANATLYQLNEMIELREEQLRQDTVALKNLKVIYEELKSMTCNENNNMTISEILGIKL